MRAGVPLLTGAEEVRFEVVPGGHLGMLTGRAARGTTWQVLDEWFTQWASDRDTADTGREGPEPRRREPRRRHPAAPAAKPSREAIGANPTRRYGSGGSRSLPADLAQTARQSGCRQRAAAIAAQAFSQAAVVASESWPYWMTEPATRPGS